MAKKATEMKRSKPGQPTGYKEEYTQQVYRLTLLGATDKDLGEFFEVTERTIGNWKNKHASFFQAIKRGKSQADAEVAERLFLRAKGYEHIETKVFIHNGQIVTYDVIKHYPPETAAICFWLKNRAGWKDNSEMTLKDERMPKEQIEQVRECLKAQFPE